MRTVTRIKYVILVSVIIGFLFMMGSRGNIRLNDKQAKPVLETDKLLRLHVIANSNSMKDQRIKRQIREVILQETKKIFISRTVNNPKAVVNNNKSYLKKVIQDQLQTRGVDYGVKLKLGKFKFPTRSYGGLTLKAGDYQALQVELGAGAGENWWCVLFPPLCFVDSTDEVSEKELDKLVTKEEEEIPVKFKFKSVEMLRENPELAKSNLKLIRILRTSFPGLNGMVFPETSEEE
jgi:stage II sporulation protein R